MEFVKVIFLILHPSLQNKLNSEYICPTTIIKVIDKSFKKLFLFKYSKIFMNTSFI